MSRLSFRRIDVATLLLAFVVPVSYAEVHRVTLTPADNGKSFQGVSGRTEISVVPPFEPSSVSVTIDGKPVAKITRPPYSILIDLGSSLVEHIISAVAIGRDGRTHAIRAIVNPGEKPLQMDLAVVDDGRAVLANVTAPGSDPITSVEFFQGDRQLARLSAPPFRIPLPDENDSAIFATARTKSGSEAAASLAVDDLVTVDTYQIRTIPLYVTVLGPDGLPKSGLEREQFRVLDGKSEGKILEFGKAFDEPVSIALIIDASTSMTYELEKALAAATEFIGRIQRPEDRISIFSIRTVPRRELALTSDHASVAAALQTMKAGGETALYDSVAAAIRELRGEKRRRAIVVLSDGEDSASMNSFDELYEQARLEGIPIYFIVFGEHGEPDQHFDRLQLLATETGGFVTVADQGSRALRKSYEAIEQDLRSQYAIRYQIADEGRPNEWRSVRVVVKDPKLTARTIQGYFTP